MNQSQSSSDQQQHPHDGQSQQQQLSAAAAGQSLEYEDLKYFDWGAEDSGPYRTLGGTNDDQSQQSALLDQALADEADESMEPLPFGHGAGGEGTSTDSIFGFARGNYMEGIRAWSIGNFGAAPSSSSSASPAARAAIIKEDDPLPGMVRSTSGSLSSDAETEVMSESDDEVSATAGAGGPTPPSRGVTFNEQVRVLPIPPIGAYTHEQRYRMYANRFELRENKVRNKREYEFDGYDWRNATEEAHMAICPMSGELLHPAHL